MKTTVFAAILASLVLFVCACSNDSVTNTTNNTGTLPSAYSKFSSAVGVSLSGNNVVLTSTGMPDHKSVYYPTTNPLYEAYNGPNPNFTQAPGTIQQMSYTFTIPANPTAATTHSATPLGPIGISVNGVPLFNQYNGQHNPLTVEINTFDQWNGHPTPNNAYHYHVEPTHITSTKGSDALIGFLLDGFPVYGPMENGHLITNDSLDTYHGHFSVTADYPNGIYHYHITADAPYINGSGFYGTPGTVTQ